MRTLIRSAAALTLTLGVLVAARPAAALDVRVEVAPLVHVPLGEILDGVPALVQPPDTLYVNANETWLLDYTHGVGGGVSLSLLLNSWEIRYEFAALPFKSLVLTHAGLAPAGTTTPIFLPSESLEELSNRAPRRPSVGVSSLDAVLLHNVGFGYRFTPFDWVVHPYFPLNLGFAAAQLRNGAETLIGFNLQLGVGVEWDPFEAFRVGLAMRYNFTAFKNPDSGFSLGDQAIQTAQTNESSFEAVMEVLQSLTFSLHASYRF